MELKRREREQALAEGSMEASATMDDEFAGLDASFSESESEEMDQAGLDECAAPLPPRAAASASPDALCVPQGGLQCAGDWCR